MPLKIVSNVLNMKNQLKHFLMHFFKGVKKIIKTFLYNLKALNEV